MTLPKGSYSTSKESKTASAQRCRVIEKNEDDSEQEKNEDVAVDVEGEEYDLAKAFAAIAY